MYKLSVNTSSLFYFSENQSFFHLFFNQVYIYAAFKNVFNKEMYIDSHLL